MGETAIFAFGGLVLPAWTFLEAQETRGLAKGKCFLKPEPSTGERIRTWLFHQGPESEAGEQDIRVSGDTEEAASLIHYFQEEIS